MLNIAWITVMMIKKCPVVQKVIHNFSSTILDSQRHANGTWSNDAQKLKTLQNFVHIIKSTPKIFQFLSIWAVIAKLLKYLIILVYTNPISFSSISHYWNKKLGKKQEFLIFKEPLNSATNLKYWYLTPELNW